MKPAVVHQFPLPLDVDVRAVRAATGMSRTEFARRFAPDPRALQDWWSPRSQERDLGHPILVVRPGPPAAGAYFASPSGA